MKLSKREVIGGLVVAIIALGAGGATGMIYQDYIMETQWAKTCWYKETAYEVGSNHPDTDCTCVEATEYAPVRWICSTDYKVEEVADTSNSCADQHSVSIGEDKNIYLDGEQITTGEFAATPDDSENGFVWENPKFAFGATKILMTKRYNFTTGAGFAKTTYLYDIESDTISHIENPDSETQLSPVVSGFDNFVVSENGKYVIVYNERESAYWINNVNEFSSIFPKDSGEYNFTAFVNPLSAVYLNPVVISNNGVFYGFALLEKRDTPVDSALISGSYDTGELTIIDRVNDENGSLPYYQTHLALSADETMLMTGYCFVRDFVDNDSISEVGTCDTFAIFYLTN